jgi:hypothetical protein
MHLSFTLLSHRYSTSRSGRSGMKRTGRSRPRRGRDDTNSTNSVRFYDTVGTVQERQAWHRHSGMVGTAPGMKADEGVKTLISFLSMTVRSSANQIGLRPCRRTALEASTSPAPPSANVFGKGIKGNHPATALITAGWVVLWANSGGDRVEEGTQWHEEIAACVARDRWCRRGGGQFHGFSCRPHRLILIPPREGWDLIANDLTACSLMVETPCKSSAQCDTSAHWTTVLLKHDAY